MTSLTIKNMLKDPKNATQANEYSKGSSPNFDSNIKQI